MAKILGFMPIFAKILGEEHPKMAKKDFIVLKIFSIYWTVLLIILASCNSWTNSDTSSSRTFTNIDSALKYCTETKEYKSLLFAIVSKNIENNQKLGWTILGDNDIIKAAKKNYVLIIIDPTKIVLPENSDTKEFEDIIKSEKESPFFVGDLAKPVLLLMDL